MPACAAVSCMQVANNGKKKGKKAQRERRLRPADC